MMNRISFNRLSEIDKQFGDFEIGQVGGSNTVYLRFGYWNKVNLEKLQSILGNFANVVEVDDYDDDCGWKYSYYLQ